MRILELSKCPEFLNTIVDWNLKEWPKPDRSRGDVKARIFGSGTEDQLPQTLVLEENDEAIGYATMILYEKGRPMGQLHWIDAVFIKPEKRKKGLASQLIVAAEKKAATLGILELFALTDIPLLYQKLGWALCETRVENVAGTIVCRKLY